MVERLFARHGLGPVRSVAPLSGGQINPVVVVNGVYILRARPPGRDASAFRTEARLFERLRGRLPVPEVLLVDTSREAIPLDCILLRRLPGETLARLWERAGDRQRAWYAAQVAEILKTLHAERFPACGGFRSGELVPAPSWQAYFEARYERRLRRLRAFPDADRALLDAIEGYWRRRRGVLDDGPACLVHRDLHWGNLLAEGPRLTGILDFEAAVAAPPDYELDQLLRFLRYPALFIHGETAATPTPALFAGVWNLLQAAYPEPFRAKELSTRLSLYSLEYDLAALYDCYSGRWGAAAHRHVLDRIRLALEERLLPAP